MQDSHADRPPTSGSSRSALELAHRLLGRPPGDHSDLGGLLAELAGAFSASAAGLASLPGASLLACHPAPPVATEVSALLAHSGQRPCWVPRAAGGSYLLATLSAPAGTFEPDVAAHWALWVEDAQRPTWSDEEAAALDLIGLALSRWLSNLRGAVQPPRWADQLDLAARQQRMETAAEVTRRLAHDFGNVLTGILGFSELALAQQVPATSPLHSYLTEVYRGAQTGAQFTHQLRLFSRRQSTSSRACALAPLLAEEEKRLCPPGAREGSPLTLNVSLPNDLPPLALDSDHLRQVLGALLDNAREALAGPGSIAISARLTALTEADCHDLYGAARPGPHVEVCIADTGTGLSPEVQRRLFAESFFTSKPRRRGFGLAIAYGILHAHRGGLRLHPGVERGVVARVLVPAARSAPAPALAAETAAPPNSADPASAVARKARGEKVLVVDDDPQVLQLVSVTLEQAGYRVHAVSNADDALQTYLAQSIDPFRLVLSDVIMPRVTGVDLARRLVKRDANVRVLFMSGRVSADFMQPDLAQHSFELLTKPFLPEGLLRAVRSALDRPATGPRRAPSPPSGWGDQPLVSSPR